MRCPKWFIVAFVAALVGCGPESNDTTPSYAKVPVGDSPQRGSADAWVTVVEFADFQCPYCRQAQPTIQNVQSAYGDDVRLVFKHFPLSFHSRAKPASIAAQCAGYQGKFWQMHDLLFVDDLDNATIAANANQIPGLDTTVWESCLSTTQASQRVADDVTLAYDLGIRATPTFVINGTVVEGAVPESDLRTVIDDALQRAIHSGIARAQYYDKAVLGL